MLVVLVHHYAKPTLTITTSEVLVKTNQINLSQNVTSNETCQGKAKIRLQGALSFEIDDYYNKCNNLSTINGGSVKHGGHWEPVNCSNPDTVAILVPFRKRPEQLKVFLSHMHPIFQRQLLSYRVFVIEQVGQARFNKGAIYNIGFTKSLSYGDFSCYIFHDVDLLCENDFNYYGCPTSPMHMSVAVDKFHYILPYPILIGGIQAITKEHYYKLNGYSNRFWGWGGEDDNLYRRIQATGLKLKRPDVKIARYKMNQKHHFRSSKWNEKNSIMSRKKDLLREVDGVNSVDKLNFTCIETLMPLYTLISIDLYES